MPAPAGCVATVGFDLQRSRRGRCSAHGLLTCGAAVESSQRDVRQRRGRPPVAFSPARGWATGRLDRVHPDVTAAASTPQSGPPPARCRQRQAAVLEPPGVLTSVLAESSAGCPEDDRTHRRTPLIGWSAGGAERVSRCDRSRRRPGGGLRHGCPRSLRPLDANDYSVHTDGVILGNNGGVITLLDRRASRPTACPTSPNRAARRSIDRDAHPARRHTAERRDREVVDIDDRGSIWSIGRCRHICDRGKGDQTRPHRHRPTAMHS
jgi:hypothetical protein